MSTQKKEKKPKTASDSSPPLPPPHERSSSSSSNSRLAASPPVSSPLNPSTHSSSSPNTTPTQKPLPLPPLPPLPSSSTSSLPPQSHTSASAARARPRGSSVSTLRNASPPRLSRLPALDRVVSNPIQSSKSLSSSLSSLGPPPDYERHRSHSFSVAVSRSKSRSPSPGRLEFAWSALKNRSETPPHCPPRSWWNRAADDMAVRPWWDVPSPSSTVGREKKRKTVPEEQTRAWEFTKARVEKAAASVLDVTIDVVHETLRAGVDLLQLAPVVGLEEAARVLLNIWESLQLVELNRMACLRLVQRCADILISVKEEIDSAGDAVADELKDPMAKLLEAFQRVQFLLQKQIHRPFLKRYLKRDEIVREIAGCDAVLGDALGMFGLSIQIRILKQIQANEAKRQEDALVLYDSLRSLHHEHDEHEEPPHTQTRGLLLEGVQTHVRTALPPRQPLPLSIERTHTPPLTPGSLSPASPSLADPLLFSPSHFTQDNIRAALEDLKERENEIDKLRDMRDLRTLLRTALATRSDVELVQVLQVARDEMPEAIKTLQRELEREVDREWEESQSASSEADGDEVRLEEQPLENIIAEWGEERSLKRVDDRGLDRKGSTSSGKRSVKTKASVTSIGTRVGSQRDTLDREFIEEGIQALKRMSRGTEMSLPSWTITRYEVDREEKIGMGFFSDVYRGSWRSRAVAIKVLSQTTPRKLFVHEIEIWRTLEHPNVLPLLGASSASGDPPWFFVSPYCKNGSLVEYLKGAGDGADLLKMMHEVSEGMQYLHGKGILHGDLKAANVLVDDDLRCVISDFGQSEMKSEVYRVSGTPPPHGTLRWQSPELMAGNSQLTQQMDVYAFAICCVEILGRGKMPWAMTDDDNVRHFVLDRNMRPELPPTSFTTHDISHLIRACWHRSPSSRPSFASIARDIRQLRKKAGWKDTDSPPTEWKMRGEPEHKTRPSPDPRPIPLLPDASLNTEEVPVTGISPGSTDASYMTATGDAGEAPYSSNQTIHPARTHSDDRASILSGPLLIGMPEPHPYAPSPGSRPASMLDTSSDSASEIVLLDPGYVSPPPLDEFMAETKNERRYRMLLQHEFNPSLVLPLWTPGQVSVGDVGYLSGPSGEFVALLNAFDPVKTSKGVAKGMPSLYGYGRVTTGSQRQDKRNAAQRGWDVIQGFLPSRRIDYGSSQPVSRRYSFQLRAGHKTAYLCTETTMHRYVDKMDAPKKWFKANADSILQLYGQQHEIQKEDLYLIIGTLDAPDYALFVSHHHRDGQVHFNVFATPKAGQHWGEFSTDFTDEELGPPPSFQEEAPGGANPFSTSKVSTVKNSGKWDSVLLARLRFKPDDADPTSL